MWAIRNAGALRGLTVGRELANYPARNPPGEGVATRMPHVTTPLRVLLATTATPDDRKTVCCARSLGRAGAWVAVGADRFWGQAYYSRHVRRRVRYPHPRLGVPAFVEALDRHVHATGCRAVLAMNDYTQLALAAHRDALPAGVVTALPSFETVDLACDKMRTLELARRLGIETPHTWAVHNEDDLHQAADRVGYPCVMKLRRGAGAIGFRVLPDRDSLIAAYRQPRLPSDLVYDRDCLLVQEYIPGETRDACVLLCHGEPRAGYTQRRVRTYPAEGGVGTLVETTDEPGLLARANRLMSALNWHGPAQVEFRVDPRTGAARLIEVNGRLWGTTAVAVRAGVDFPLLTCRLAVDGDVPPMRGYRVGLRYRFPFPFGLLALAEDGLRLSTTRDFFAPARGVCSDLSWRDPLPHLAEAGYIVRRAIARRSLRPQPATQRA